MSTLIIIFGVALYLLTGAWMFTYSVNKMGGKTIYLEEMQRSGKTKMNVNLAYYSAFILVTLFWPFFIIAALCGGNE